MRKNITPGHRLSEIIFSPIVETIKLRESRPDLLKLNQGVPNFPTPPHILMAAIKAIKDDKVNVYSDTFGLVKLREAIAKKLLEKNHVWAHVDNLIVTTGASEGILLGLLLLANPGDEVYLTDPAYASHIEQVYLAGLRPVFIPLGNLGEDWSFDPKVLEEDIINKRRNGRTLPKCILICTPNNPTGFVFSKQELIEVGKIATRYGLFIITDETYEDYVFDGASHFSLGSEPGLIESCVSCFSFSKSYAMTGWRVGYMVVPKRMIDQARMLQDDLVICAPVVSQYAALSALNEFDNNIMGYLLKLNAQRLALKEAIQRIHHLKLLNGKGAFYLFPKLLISLDSDTYCRRLANEANVLAVPGKGFGPSGKKHIRLSFITEKEDILEACRKIQEWEP